jgi:hypothetical protein
MAQLTIDLQGLPLILDTNYIVRRWNGTTWESLGTARTADVREVVVGPDGTLYVRNGSFAPFVQRWNGTTWEDLPSTGLTSIVYVLMVAPDNTLWAAGSFAGVVRRYNVASASWEVVGNLAASSGTAQCRGLLAAANGLVYATGIFDLINGRQAASGFGIWNGSVWTTFGVDGGSSLVAEIVRTPNGQIWTVSGGAVTVAGVATVTNAGTASVSPRIIVTNASTTLALRLYSVGNERTGATIFIDAELAPGETLTIDCEAKTVSSSYRINAINAILPGSQFGRFALLPGTNPISLMTSRTTDVTASVAYTNRYWSNDV